MAHKIELWERAREYYESGLTLANISKRIGISKSQISKRAIRELWEKGNEKEKLIAQAVEVLAQKENFKETELRVHEELVSERVRRERLVFGNAEKLAKKIGKMSDNVDSPSDIKLLVEANDKAAITLGVAERHAPKAVQAVQVNNNVEVIDPFED